MNGPEGRGQEREERKISRREREKDTQSVPEREERGPQLRKNFKVFASNREHLPFPSTQALLYLEFLDFRVSVLTCLDK